MPPAKVTTTVASNVTATRATLHGYVNSGSGIDIDTWFWMDFNNSVSCHTDASNHDGIGTSQPGQSFSHTVSVIPNTKYYYRFCGKDRYGNVSSESLAWFTSAKPAAVRVSTQGNIVVSETRAKLFGRIESGNGVNMWMKYSTNSNLSCDFGSYGGMGSGNAGGLYFWWANILPNKTYFYRMCGKDKYGRTSAGVVKSFKSLVPCEGNFKKSGSTRSYFKRRLVGDSPGRLYYTIMGYGDPTRLVLKHKGKVLVDTGNTTFYTTGDFNFTPGGDPYIYVEVYNNDPNGGVWDVTLSCPR